MKVDLTRLQVSALLETTRQMRDKAVDPKIRGMWTAIVRRLENALSPAETSAGGPGNTLEITMYIHCVRCLNELNVLAAAAGWENWLAWREAVRRGETSADPSMSPDEYSRLDVGWTPIGLQVYCRRHNKNVIHLDFEGEAHPANVTGRRGSDGPASGLTP